MEAGKLSSRLVAGDVVMLTRCSRQALKKYVQHNNTITVTSQATFDAQFNRALKAAVEKGEFTQPKGSSLSLLLSTLVLTRV